MTVYQWGARSERIRAELDPDLAMLFDIALEISPFDLAITDGHRGEEAQMMAFESGASKLQWPESCHNSMPSRAGHLDPSPINYKNWLRYYGLAGVVFAAAKRLGLESRVRWGGDWDKDWDLNEETFRDLAHYELVGEEA